MVEANPKPYAIRMKEARAALRALRVAEQAARQRQTELIVTARMMALDAVKATIRDRGEKVQHFTMAQLRTQADEMMRGPWLMLKARARIAERNSQHLSKTKVPDNRGLLVNRTHDQN
jgi:hypothetical protein